MPSKKLKPIPRFESEDEEFEFWSTHSTADYIDWSKARRVQFPNLPPPSPTKTISIRLPESLLNDLKMLAKKRDIPYQSLLKALLHQSVREELRKDREAAEAMGRPGQAAAEAEQAEETSKRRRRGKSA